MGWPGKDYRQMVMEEASPLTVGGELHRLLDSGDYWGCLAEGRILLEQEKLSEAERARVLSLLCRCHLALGQLQGAVAAGELAARLADRNRLWDVAGSARLDLANALTALRRYQEALDSLDRYRQGLPEYTAARCQEGAALQQAGLVLARMGRPEESVGWYARAHHWFHRYGDERSAADCLLGMVDACLAAGDLPGAAIRLAEAEARGTDEPDFTGQLLLARARYLQLKGEHQASVDEAFKALVLAQPCSRLQVEAQLHLSRMAEVMGRPVEALCFAFAARVSAIDGRLYTSEFEASALLVRLIRAHGPTPVAELSTDLDRQGVDIYQYIHPAEVERLARGE